MNDSGAGAEPVRLQPRGGLFGLPVRRPVATTMFFLAVATFGYISARKIPIQLLPEISYPTITVRTEYQGAGPEDVEERISKRIEESLAVLPGLERHASVSRPGVSDVVLEFAWGTNLSYATQEIRERLDRTPLPDDAGRPLILRYDPNSQPMMRLSVYGDRGLEKLREVAEDVVAKGLQTIPGVAAVKVRGGLETEIRVTLDEQKLTNLRLDISEVDRRLKIENVNLASGKLVEGDTEYLVRTLNQFRSLDEILELALAERDGQPIRLRDLATVERTHKERDVITRVDAQESVELLVHREADANIVALAAEVRDRVFGSAAQRKLLEEYRSGRRPDPEPLLREALAKAERTKDTAPATAGTPGPGAPPTPEEAEVQRLRAELAAKRAAEDYLTNTLPPGVSVQVLADDSRAIEEAIADVRGSALLGGLLAVLVLLLVLRDLGATLLIATTIPISIVATFAPMYLSGITFNIMSLGGLALGIGMLVDNSIVVLESVFRCREEGDARKPSAVRGAAEVGSALVASTLTTVAVFFPIAFVSGISGQLFGDQALTVVYAQFTSLGVGLFFIPMLAALGLEAGQPDRLRRALPLQILLPAFVWRRTLAWRGFTAFVGGGGRMRRWLRLLPGLVLFALQVVVESLARVVLAVAALLLVAVLGVVRALVRLLGVVMLPVHFVVGRPFQLLARAYPGALRATLVHPPLAVLVLLLAAAGGLLAWFLFPHLGSRLLPEVRLGELLVRVYQQVGTPVESAAANLLDVERAIRALPGVERVASAVGVARDEVAEPDEGSHSARMLVTLDRAYLDRAANEERAQLEERVKQDIRHILATQPEVTGPPTFDPTMFSIRTPVAVEARGEDLVELREAAAELAARMGALAALTDVRSTMTRGNPEVHLTFDRERLRRHGLDIEAIANRIRAEVQGVVSTRFAEGERRVDVRVLADVDTVQRLLDVTVNRGRAMDLADTLDRGTEGGGGSSGTGTARMRDRTLIPGTTVDLGESAPIPLRQVASVRQVEGPSEIRRINGQRAAVVTGNPRGLDMGRAVTELHSVMAATEARYPGVLCSLGGQGAEMGQALQGMKTVLLLAVFLVYLVMAAQFESLLQPLIILLSVPLALVGGVLALYVTSTPVSVVALIGGVVLAGIVVSNAIVLLDYTNQLRHRGIPVADALVEAARVRLRPIFMTTATAVLGLVPLAGALSKLPLGGILPGSVWRGSDLQAPMAIVLIGGLVLSTLLTLFVIPVVYRMVLHRTR